MDEPWAVTTDFGYGTAAIVEYVTDSVAAADRCVRIVDAIGARGRSLGDVTAGLAALEQGVAGDVVLIDIGEDAGPPLDRLFDRLQLSAKERGLPSVVIVPDNLIDPAAARLTAPDVNLLCAPDDLEIAAALGLALAPGRGATVREEGHEIELRRLSEEVSRIARTLAGLSTAEPAIRHNPPEPFGEEDFAAPTSAAVRLMLRARRLRDRYFAVDLFADPAWDMLLDLMLARLEGRSVAVSSLCIAAAVPPTTALRWIRRLTDEGLFVRTADPRDGRRIFIDLSDSAAEAMGAYFRGLSRLGLPLP
jgi:hypothetical protein